VLKIRVDQFMNEGDGRACLGHKCLVVKNGEVASL